MMRKRATITENAEVILTSYLRGALRLFFVVIANPTAVG